MRPWHCIAAIVLVSGAIGYWWHSTRFTTDLDLPKVERPRGKDDGDAESCDAIEPMIVDRERRGLVNLEESPPVEMEAQPRVVLAPGVMQPPRPTAARRMPYADEDEEAERMQAIERTAAYPLVLVP